MDIEKLLNKRRKLRNKIEDTKELISWTNKLFKNFNLLTIIVLAGFSTLTIPLVLFFTDLFPVSIALNKLLPIGTFGFICSMTTGGILVLNNIVIISSKLILKHINKKLSQKLNETSALISRKYREQNNIEQKKQLQKAQENKAKETKNNPYKYSYDALKNNFISTMNNYLESRNNEKQPKGKVRTRTK